MQTAESIQTTSGAELRALIRTGEFSAQTGGQAPDYLQGNLVILPARYASEFLLFCTNNPKPCPLVGLSIAGDPMLPALGTDIDIRSDIPQYRIYKDGDLCDQVADIADYWGDDMVTFILGCSLTFEDALISAGYRLRHVEQDTIVPMFKTSIATIPGGIFKGPLVVSMRPIPKSDVAAVFDVCSHYPHAHGPPVYWGDPAEIGISDINRPDYGDPVEIREGEVPVFWACGVTPQAAIDAARPAICITHAPGHMLVTDIRAADQTYAPLSMASVQSAM